jgi:hypothetical protein
MYKKGSKWKKRDYKYTAVNRVPAIHSPAPGSELDSTSVEFGWQHNNAYIRNFKLWVGSSQGEKDIYDSGLLPGTDTAHTAKKLPFDGSTIYVRLRYKSGVKWLFVDYQYTVTDRATFITSPVPDSTLTHSTVEFVWDSGGLTVQKYRLYVGKNPGDNDHHDSDKLPGTTLQ